MRHTTKSGCLSQQTLLDPPTSILHPRGAKLEMQHYGKANTSVDWLSFHRAWRSSKPSWKRFVTKWISGNTATGRVILNRQKRAYSNCPLCQEPDGHLLHILTCPHPDSVMLRCTLVHELQSWLVREHTHPNITAFFLNGLNSWFQDPYGHEISVAVRTHLLVQHCSIN